MTMDQKNMPILYRNIIYGLNSEFAINAFLWAVEKPGEDRNCYRAERFAREAERMALTFPRIVQADQYNKLKSGGHLLDGDQTSNLLDFILIRHANWRFGGNVSPPYAGRLS